MAGEHECATHRSAGRVRAGSRRGALALLLAGALGLGAAGCGSDDDEAGQESAGTSGAAASANLDVDATLQRAYEGIVDEVPTSGPVAEPGKTIWFSNCLGFEGCARFGAGVKEAARVLGWTIKEVDNENNPSKSISIIRQAISANADGVSRLT